MKYECYPLQRLVHRYRKKEDVTVCKSLCKVAVTVFFICVINTGLDVYLSITGTLYARSLCRCRRWSLLVVTTWIINRYICFETIEKPRILILKNHCFQSKKQQI